MPILGPAAKKNPLIASDDWENNIPRVENRPEMIVAPSQPTWDTYLTGKEGYVGRDGIISGGMFGHDGQPYIQTPDMVLDTHDLIHWHELRRIHTMFEKKSIPEKVAIAGKTLVVENKSEDYFQGVFEEDQSLATIFRTYRTFLVGLGAPETNLREQYVGMRRVADFFMITTF